MRITSHRLRSNIVKKKTVAEEDAFLKEKFERARRYQFLIIIIGLSASFNLNTALLTPIIFNCEEFSSKCLMLYITGGCLSLVLSTFFISYKSIYLILFQVLISLSQTAHALIGLFGSGYIAKLLFILFYFCHGFVESFLIQAASYVTNKYLLISLYSKLYVGFSLGRIVLGTIQGILEKTIGTDTIWQCRRIVFLCHSTQALLGYIAVIWAFILYIECLNVKDDEGDKENNDQGTSTGDGSPSGGSELGKWEQVKKVVPYMKYFYWRPLLYMISYIPAYFYYPFLVPYCLNISRSMKLMGYVLYSYCDLIGRTIGSTLNKELDDEDKKDNESHFKFLFSKDIKFILLLIFSHGSFIILTILAWNNHPYSKTTHIIFPIILFGAFGFGILMTSFMNSVYAAVEYFNRQKKNENSEEKIIPDDVKKYSNTMIDIVTFINAGSMLFFTFLTNVFVELIENHRSSRPYLIRHNTRGLTEDIIDIILNTK